MRIAKTEADLNHVLREIEKNAAILLEQKLAELTCEDIENSEYAGEFEQMVEAEVEQFKFKTMDAAREAFKKGVLQVELPDQQ